MDEAKGLLLTLVVVFTAPLVIGLGLAMLRGTTQKVNETVDHGDLEPVWIRGTSTDDGTVWQYSQRNTKTGETYRTVFVIGNSNHTDFRSDSTFPRGHETINGKPAKSYATEQAATDALLALGNKPKPPMPPAPALPPAPQWPNTGSNPFGGMASAGGGFGSTDGRPSFNF